LLANPLEPYISIVIGHVSKLGPQDCPQRFLIRKYFFNCTFPDLDQCSGFTFAELCLGVTGILRRHRGIRFSGEIQQRLFFLLKLKDASILRSGPCPRTRITWLIQLKGRAYIIVSECCGEHSDALKKQ